MANSHDHQKDYAGHHDLSSAIGGHAARIDSVSDLPSWYPGSEDKPAPMPLLRVQGFVNTRDVERGTDLLAEPATVGRWLADAGLLERPSDPTSADLEVAREVRESIRALIDPGGERFAEALLEPLRALAANHRARLAVAADGNLELENAHGGELGDGLFELMLIIHGAQEEGNWSRLKLCANDECQWAFYDRSRNQQGSWCNMASCGNRLKNRQLRARRR